ncbi:hypothetical protein PF002_g30566 [Phytophthora fragariae]|uniref:Uncharacterized protein n=4 Tax=Phytophthora fragariae TaxID=53985 RepID=A0A6A3VW38_9STRA|nr:hypothetical protein PF002_g30566 [Phytophthora fragariae]
MAYARILQAADVELLDSADRPLLVLLQTSNREAFVKWSNTHRELLCIPVTRKRRAEVSELHPWLMDNYVAMRHLHAYLPYAVLEIKSWPIALIIKWGKAEVFCEQMAALLRISGDMEQKNEARKYCSEWHDACMAPGLSTTAAQALAQSPDRWKRLEHWIPASCGRARPPDISDLEWNVLRVLPYVIDEWVMTPMGRAPRGARGLWYRHFAMVRQLCTSISTQGDWSMALALTHIPTGAEGTEPPDASAPGGLSDTKGSTEHAVHAGADNTPRAPSPQNKQRQTDHCSGRLRGGHEVGGQKATLVDFYSPISDADRIRQTTTNFR